jgi:membrane associated rhomboid family serine protease
MTSAAVGFQCPECVREGRATVRQPRTVAGGLIRGAGGDVTRVIVAGTVAVFVLQIISENVTRQLALVDVGVAAGQWYRLLSVVLVHESVLHIAFNMYALWVVGQQVEVWLGRTRFITLYVVSALAGSAFSFAFGSEVSVGASGAIYGVFGALAVFSRRLGYDMRPAIALIAINLFLSFSISNIDWHAHVGGLVGGVILAVAFAYTPQSMRTMGAVAATALVVVAALGMTAVHTQHLRDDPSARQCIDQLNTCLAPLQINVLRGGL